MNIHKITLLSCIVLLSAGTIAKGAPHVADGEWQVTNTSVGGVAATNTLCLPKSGVASWMILTDPGKGFSCKKIGNTVVEHDGRIGIFQERCFLDQPQVGVVQMNMRFRVVIGHDGRRLHSTAIGEGVEHGYTFPINTTTVGHYLGLCR